MKTTVYIATSLDGFIARSDGGIDWLTPFESEEVFRTYNSFMKAIDGIVIGRGTFEKVLTFPAWPYRKNVFVLSRSLGRLPGSLQEKATVLALSPRELLVRLQSEGHSRLYVDGGKVIQSFLRDDCIDEMILTRVPVLLGGGIPLFGVLARELAFLHVRTDAFPNGLVQSSYVRIRP
jgi:dihydrofolate reductase